MSVGNISTGGSGKTPFVILLGELLRARGIRFDVLSRGYGRTTRGVLRVDPGGLPSDFGDEPLLISRRLQSPVVVGEDRYEAGRFAESQFGRRFICWMMGFNIVAWLAISILCGNSRRCPRSFASGGASAEPLRSLQRADAVVLTSGASPESFPWRARRCGGCGGGLLRKMFRPGRLCSAALRGPRILSAVAGGGY